MTPTHIKAKSLSGRIFATVLVFAVVVVVAFGMLMTTIFYFVEEQRAESHLADQAEMAAETLDAVPADSEVALLSDQFDGALRYTLIDPDGAVLYDSVASAGDMENHADRPEVIGTEATGDVATTARYSETLSTDTLYAAALLDDGRVIRLAEERGSLVSFIGDMVAPVTVAVVVVVVLAFAVSRMLTKRIMQPIDALDFSRPLDNDIYVEMDPLLIRIDEQQKQLVQQNKELALAENMRRDFSSNVSHEMKTPLQVISGYAELMKNGMVDPDDQQRFSELIYEEAQSMRSLINDVLTLSMLDEAAYGYGFAQVDLFAVVQRVASRIASVADSHHVDVRFEGEPATIEGNATLAEEMIYNLVENGIRYNHEGGSVVVSVTHEATRDLASADRGVTPAQAKHLRNASVGETLAAQRQVVVRVSDTGPGIPEELHDKIFERFFRMEKSRSKETGGTGLGLAIVKHAVMYHGGTIAVESKEGAGTTFVMRFADAEH